MNVFGFLGSAAGAAAGSAVKDALTGVGNLATSIRGAITGELPPDVRARLEELALTAEAQAKLSQNAITQVEAAHPSIFVAGWRPFIGWVCGMGIAYAFIARDLMAWVLRLFAPQVEPPPFIGAAELMTLVTGMLGIAGMRSYEKSKKAEGNR